MQLANRDKSFIALASLTCVAALCAVLIMAPRAVHAQVAGTGVSVRAIAPFRVTVGASAVQLTTTANLNGGVFIKCICTGQTVYVGTSSAVATTTGYPLTDGQELMLQVRNANELWVIASASSQAVAVLPFTRY